MKRIFRRRFFASQSGNRKSKTCGERRRTIENPKWVGCLAILLVLTGWVRMVDAQQPGTIFRIGYLDSSTASGSAVLVEAL